MVGVRDAKRPSTTAFLHASQRVGYVRPSEASGGGRGAAGSAIRYEPTNGSVDSTTDSRRLGFSVVDRCSRWPKPYTQRDSVCSAQSGMSPIGRREGLQVPEVCPVSPTSQPRVTMSVNETADLLGISRWLAYEQIQRGELPVIRMGRRLRVPADRCSRSSR